MNLCLFYLFFLPCVTESLMYANNNNSSSSGGGRDDGVMYPPYPAACTKPSTYEMSSQISRHFPTGIVGSITDDPVNSSVNSSRNSNNAKDSLISNALSGCVTADDVKNRCNTSDKFADSVNPYVQENESMYTMENNNNNNNNNRRVRNFGDKNSPSCHQGSETNTPVSSTGLLSPVLASTDIIGQACLTQELEACSPDSEKSIEYSDVSSLSINTDKNLQRCTSDQDKTNISEEATSLPLSSCEQAITSGTVAPLLEACASERLSEDSSNASTKNSNKKKCRTMKRLTIAERNNNSSGFNLEHSQSSSKKSKSTLPVSPHRNSESNEYVSTNDYATNCYQGINESKFVEHISSMKSRLLDHSYPNNEKHQGQTEIMESVRIPSSSSLSYLQCKKQSASSNHKNNSREHSTLTEPPKSSKPLHPMLSNVTATLELKSLWEDFNELGTEMIVTKAGR